MKRKIRIDNVSDEKGKEKVWSTCNRKVSTQPKYMCTYSHLYLSLRMRHVFILLEENFTTVVLQKNLLIVELIELIIKIIIVK